MLRALQQSLRGAIRQQTLAVSVCVLVGVPRDPATAPERPSIPARCRCASG